MLSAEETYRRNLRGRSDLGDVDRDRLRNGMEWRNHLESAEQRPEVSRFRRGPGPATLLEMKRATCLEDKES